MHGKPFFPHDETNAPEKNKERYWDNVKNLGNALKVRNKQAINNTGAQKQRTRKKVNDVVNRLLGEPYEPQ